MINHQPKTCQFCLIITIISLFQDYAMKEVLCGGYLADEYKPELIDMVLEKLTPDQVRVAVIGKKFEGKTDKTEKWYGTNYSLTPIPEDTLNVSIPIRINEYNSNKVIYH